MSMIPAFALAFAVFAVGDLISKKTRGYLSAVFFCFVFYLFGFWTFLPKSFFNDTGMVAVNFPFLCLLMVNMGTTVKIRDILSQWKTIIIAFIVCSFLCIGPILIIPLFMDRLYAYIGGPVLSGAITAALIMQDAAKAVGRVDLAVFATAVLALQSVAGIPLATFCLKREAVRLLQGYRNGQALSAWGEVSGQDRQNQGKGTRGFLIPQIPKEYLTGNVLIAKSAAVACLAWLGSRYLFGGRINAMIWCLALGLLFKELGFLEENGVSLANGAVFVFALPMLNCLTGLTDATPEMILGQLVPLVSLFAVAILAMIAVSFVLSRIFRCSWYLVIAIGSSALFGFPITLLLSNEVANTSGQTPEEQSYLRECLEPIMVISGIVTVTISSVIFAGIISNLI